MARRDRVSAASPRMIEERAKLDLAVAKYVGVWRAAGGVLAKKRGEDALAILGGEIDRFELDPDDVRHGCSVHQVLPRWAVFVGVVVFPVLHEDADDFVPRTLQQPRGHRRIDSAGETEHDALPLGHTVPSAIKKAEANGPCPLAEHAGSFVAGVHRRRYPAIPPGNTPPGAGMKLIVRGPRSFPASKAPTASSAAKPFSWPPFVPASSSPTSPWRLCDRL